MLTGEEQREAGVFVLLTIGSDDWPAADAGVDTETLEIVADDGGKSIEALEIPCFEGGMGIWKREIRLGVYTSSILWTHLSFFFFA